MSSKAKKFFYRAIYLILFIIGIFGGILVFDNLIMPAYTGSRKTCPIPDVVGLAEPIAEKRAKDEGFNFLVTRKEHSDTIPEGLVILQRPEPGSYAKKGRRVSVVVSLSAACAPVPDVTGIHHRAAKLEIEKAGFVLGEIVEEHSDSIPHEMIISTNPPAGDEPIIGSKIDMVVSIGSETGLVRVPNFMGQLVDDAEDLGGRVGLIVRIRYRQIPSVPDKTVYRQSVDPGALVERGSTIVVIVARGER